MNISHRHMLTLAADAAADAEREWRKGKIRDENLRNHYIETHRALLIAERLVAEDERRPHAIEWRAGSKFKKMAHGAWVISDSFKCALVFGNECAATRVLFQHPRAHRLSNISDETITGHPLFGSGLDAYGAFIVVNSPWLVELCAIDAVHPQHLKSNWTQVHHYMLCLKDCLFEAVSAREPEWQDYTSRDAAIEDVQKMWQW